MFRSLEVWSPLGFPSGYYKIWLHSGRVRGCSHRNALLPLLPRGAGCLGNPSTGKLRPAELCLSLAGLQFSPACSYCPLGYSGAIPSLQAMGTAVSASQGHVPAQLATSGAHWRGTNCLGKEKCRKLCKGNANLPPFGTASFLTTACPKVRELGAHLPNLTSCMGLLGILGKLGDAQCLCVQGMAGAQCPGCSSCGDRAWLCVLTKVPSFVLTSCFWLWCCSAGHVRLTFFGQWTEVEPQCCSQAQEELYSAPGKGHVPCLLLPSAQCCQLEERGASAGSEMCLAWHSCSLPPALMPLALSAEVGGIMEPTEAADCWSFGSLLYELLTGVVRGRGALQGGGEEEVTS